MSQLSENQINTLLAMGVVPWRAKYLLPGERQEQAVAMRQYVCKDLVQQHGQDWSALVYAKMPLDESIRSKAEALLTAMLASVGLGCCAQKTVEATPSCCLVLGGVAPSGDQVIISEYTLEAALSSAQIKRSFWQDLCRFREYLHAQCEHDDGK